jgi:squalene/oxidosqualene cyclase-like protein
MVQPALKRGKLDDPVDRALARGLERLTALQNPDGSWCGDYGGPMFLLPMYVAAFHAGRREIPAPVRRRMVAYIESTQHEAGSVGLHVEAEEPCLFTTVLCYVALRLLGQPGDAPAAARMRAWIRESGGALGAAPWGKFTLALLNLYPYEGLHPVTPELWLLPYRMPMHPGRLWCHCRQVYLPMAYLYGIRAAIPEDDLVRALRQEIYDAPYESIRFEQHRDTLYEGEPTPRSQGGGLYRGDRLVAPSRLLSVVNRLTGLYERLHLRPLREAALSKLLEHIAYEDRATSFIRIGPVNAVLNTFVHLFAGSEDDVARSFETLEGYLWDGHDGVKMNGYNSCALWDTAFASQAILAAGPHAEKAADALSRAHDYIRDNQVLEDLPDDARFFRHRCRGGWPFSDRAHGWPITDCTAEGLKSALALEHRVDRPVPAELLEAAVELILSFQNRDGSWSTYELKRGGDWLELLNPSCAFADIMVDYGYVECTSACVQALTRGRARFPGRFDRRIARAVRRGQRFLRRAQRPDGSFEGSWAVCFTYGTWFGVWGLMAAGADADDPAVARACAFLEAHQNADGGWGEHYRSCLERRYVPRESQAVNTAWALLTLTRAGRGDTPAAHRAARFLVERQQPDGDWPREAMVGVFNKTTLINYENYRRYFPLWALGTVSSRSSS